MGGVAGAATVVDPDLGIVTAHRIGGNSLETAR
jgi:hypothetical protein